MKNLSLAGLLALLCLSACTDTSITPGNTKFRLISVTSDDGDTTHYTYNTTGVLTKVYNIYQRDIRGESISIPTYENGKLVKINNENTTVTGTTNTSEEFVYDGDHLILHKSFVKKDGSDEYRLFANDSFAYRNGVFSTFYNRVIPVHDGQDQPLRIVTVLRYTWKDGNIDSAHVFSVDENGAETPYFTYGYTYNTKENISKPSDQGVWIMMQLINPGFTSKHNVLSYRAAPVVPDPALGEEETYEYNTDGLLQVIKRRVNNKLVTITYNYEKAQ